jgi:hypothetical protein
MQSKLALCGSYLDEVESKLKELLALRDNSVETKGKLAEAFAFVQEARRVVRELTERGMRRDARNNA